MIFDRNGPKKAVHKLPTSKEANFEHTNKPHSIKGTQSVHMSCGIRPSETSMPSIEVFLQMKISNSFLYTEFQAITQNYCFNKQNPNSSRSSSPNIKQFVHYQNSHSFCTSTVPENSISLPAQSELIQCVNKYRTIHAFNAKKFLTV